MRRYHYPFNGKKFIGNTNKNEVHDLDNEKTSCQIDKIKLDHIVTFVSDSLSEAHSQGFDNCAHCIGQSKY